VGNTLPLDSWRRRHRGIVWLLWAHVPALFAFGLFTGSGWSHSLLEVGLIASLAWAAGLKRMTRGAASVMATAGLITCSAVLTHFSGGVIESHFHFFVMVAVITLYQSWLPFGVAIAYVLVHHGLAGVIDPGAVFNHPDAVAHPWRWAIIHAIFVAGESIACLIAWRLNELALEGEKGARRAMQKAIDDLAEAQQIARIGSYEWHPSTGDVWWSDELYRIYGFEPASVEPSFDLFLSLVDEADRERVSAELEVANRNSERIDFTFRITQGEQSCVIHALGTPTVDARGAARFVGTCQDVTAQKRLEEEIQFRAFHDPLTELANRALFLDRLEHALARRGGMTSTVVLFIDLDDFKSVNDGAGHASGDKLLALTGARLSSMIRPSDTAARLGGDEFALLLEDTGPEDARLVAERVAHSFQEPFVLEGQEVLVRASVGVAIASDGTNADHLLRDADLAMYAVKTSGKNGFEICDLEMREAMLQRIELKKELARAVENEEFVLNFQPIVDLDTEDVLAVEALVRWQSPTRGIVPPNDFIPIAEETGLIVPLGAWILKEGTRRAKGFQEALGRRFAISINLSAQQLIQPGLVELVTDCLERSGLAPDDLILEITETVLMDNREVSVDRLQSLRALGVKIAIDDFGTGYSSLSYLNQFPIDILKIDRAFVSGVAGGAEDAALAQAVIKLASILSLRAVAEGIETLEQLDVLKSLGCASGQGYLFAKPLSTADLHDWLARSSSRSSRPRLVKAAS
jgi:diguanylate cyclase (GGDEF)-like protein